LCTVPVWPYLLVNPLLPHSLECEPIVCFSVRPVPSFLYLYFSFVFFLWCTFPDSTVLSYTLRLLLLVLNFKLPSIPLRRASTFPFLAWSVRSSFKSWSERVLPFPLPPPLPLPLPPPFPLPLPLPVSSDALVLCTVPVWPYLLVNPLLPHSLECEPIVCFSVRPVPSFLYLYFSFVFFLWCTFPDSTVLSYTLRLLLLVLNFKLPSIPLRRASTFPFLAWSVRSSTRSLIMSTLSNSLVWLLEFPMTCSAIIV